MKKTPGGEEGPEHVARGPDGRVSTPVDRVAGQPLRDADAVVVAKSGKVRHAAPAACAVAGARGLPAP